MMYLHVRLEETMFLLFKKADNKLVEGFNTQVFLYKWLLC